MAAAHSVRQNFTINIRERKKNCREALALAIEQLASLLQNIVWANADTDLATILRTHGKMIHKALKLPHATQIEKHATQCEDRLNVCLSKMSGSGCINVFNELDRKIRVSIKASTGSTPVFRRFDIEPKEHYTFDNLALIYWLVEVTTLGGMFKKRKWLRVSACNDGIEVTQERYKSVDITVKLKPHFSNFPRTIELFNFQFHTPSRIVDVCEIVKNAWPKSIRVVGGMTRISHSASNIFGDNHNVIMSTEKLQKEAGELLQNQRPRQIRDPREIGCPEALVVSVPIGTTSQMLLKLESGTKNQYYRDFLSEIVSTSLLKAKPHWAGFTPLQSRDSEEASSYRKFLQAKWRQDFDMLREACVRNHCNIEPKLFANTELLKLIPQNAPRKGKSRRTYSLLPTMMGKAQTTTNGDPVMPEFRRNLTYR